MTHPNECYSESNPLDQMIQVLDEYGFDGMARAIEILVNEQGHRIKSRMNSSQAGCLCQG